jgi:flagellar brake protein
MPMSLEVVDAAEGSLAEFRIDAPREVASMLKQLEKGCVPITLGARDGRCVDATLWASDAARGKVCFNVDASDPALPALVEGAKVIAVAYLASVKLQFEAADPVLVHGGGTSTLQCSHPREVFRIQRRSAFRVRPPMRHAPVARFAPTDPGAAAPALRVLDLSIGGCALLLTPEAPPMRVGVVAQQVAIELDADTRFTVDLRLQHVTALNFASGNARLGCEFVRIEPGALRTLQRFIDLTQKRERLLAID